MNGINCLLTNTIPKREINKKKIGKKNMYCVKVGCSMIGNWKNKDSNVINEAPVPSIPTERIVLGLTLMLFKFFFL
jgi:hypothetical protein